MTFGSMPSGNWVVASSSSTVSGSMAMDGCAPRGSDAEAGELSIGRPPTGVTTTRTPSSCEIPARTGPTVDQVVWVAA